MVYYLHEHSKVQVDFVTLQIILIQCYVYVYLNDLLLMSLAITRVIVKATKEERLNFFPSCTWDWALTIGVCCLLSGLASLVHLPRNSTTKQTVITLRHLEAVLLILRCRFLKCCSIQFHDIASRLKLDTGH